MFSKIKGITWRYYSFSFLSGLSFYTAALIPFYTIWGHISLTQVMFLQTWLMFWAFVLEIPTGVIADKFGRKFSVVLGGLMSFASFLVYGSFPHFPAFLLAEFLAATGIALMSGANEALLYDSLKEEGGENKFKKVFGKSFSVGQISAIISAPLGGFIAAKYGLNAPMLFTAIPVLLATVILMTAKEPERKHTNKEEKKYFQIAKDGVSFFVHHKILRSLAFNGIIVYTGVYFLVWLYQPILQNIGVAIIYFGFIRSLFSLSGMLFNHDLPRLEKMFGSSKNFFNLSTVLSSLSLFLVALAPSLTTILIAIVVLGGLGQARFTALSSYMNSHIASEQRATTLSAISMLVRVVLITLNPLVGYIADHSTRGAFAFLGVLPILALVFVPISFGSDDAQT